VLEPLLVTNVGETVAGVWTSPDGSQRWYILPGGLAWNTVLGWLATAAVLELVPSAAQRARPAGYTDPAWQSTEEVRLRSALDALHRRYQSERAELQTHVDAVEVAASAVREPLLYGTGDALVQGVAQVFRDARMTVVDLDNELGSTSSGDLLVAHDGRRRLVEVKGVKQAGERLVDDVQRHLTTWPALRPQWPVEGGTLVVNHQYTLPPQERDREAYRRREFVETLTVQVVSTTTLLRLWLNQDGTGIRQLLFPKSGDDTGSSLDALQPRSDADAPPVPTKRGWFRRPR